MFIFVIAGRCFHMAECENHAWVCLDVRFPEAWTWKKKFSIKFGVDLTFCGVLFAVRY